MCTLSTSEASKSGSGLLSLFTLLTCKCASRRNSVHFFDIPTSQKWFDVGVLLYILTWKCASRHKCVHLFDIATSKSAPKLRCFVHFDLEIVLRATTACNFACLIWPHGSAPAALASLLFDPPEPQIIGKTRWIATSLPFRAPASSFFALFLFSHLLTASFLLSDSSHLYFASVHIVGSLTSKLPLINMYIYIYIYLYIYIYIY